MLSVRGLRQRSMLLQAIRSFFLDRGYLEVDTPLRLPVLIPEANILPFTSEDWYLQTSPELCMKRLLAGGCEKLFQICHCFRKEEQGRYHQSEFCMLEWYQSGWDYTNLMEECEALIRQVCRNLEGFDGLAEATLLRSGHRIRLDCPWERLTVKEAFELYAPVDLADALETGRFDEHLVEAVEPNLGWRQPVFLCDYPLELAALSREKSNNPGVAERFELYIAGLELANGFSELTDAVEQRRRFDEERERAARHFGAMAMPEKFLHDLQGLGEAAGIALGVDRLLLLLSGKEHLREVLPFDQDEL